MEPADRCRQSETTTAYAVQALRDTEVAAAEAHVAVCRDCQREIESLRTVLERLVYGPADVVSPSASLPARLARRIADETGTEPEGVAPTGQPWPEPEWEDVAPGIECKILASDAARGRVSMLVRLAAGATYPAHTHADQEELYLLHGELWIDDRKLMAGDYNYGAPGSGDERVWSETGCTCVLITSAADILR